MIDYAHFVLAVRFMDDDNDHVRNLARRIIEQETEPNPLYDLLVGYVADARVPNRGLDSARRRT